MTLIFPDGACVCKGSERGGGCFHSGGQGHGAPGQLHTQQPSSLPFTVPSDFIVPKKIK